ncbi:unnamed protein product, partial [Urochloa humidicola]
GRTAAVPSCGLDLRGPGCPARPCLSPGSPAVGVSPRRRPVRPRARHPLAGRWGLAAAAKPGRGIGIPGPGRPARLSPGPLGLCSSAASKHVHGQQSQPLVQL